MSERKCTLAAIDFGTVKFFDSRKDKMYGFISTGDGSPDIWFHFNDLRMLEAQDEGVVFINETPTNLVLPQIGESVVFERAAGKGGKPKACPWNYYRHYTKAVAILDALIERNADLHEKAMLAELAEPGDNVVINDTVFTDHASGGGNEELEECTVCGRTTGCNCTAEECFGCHELLRDCTCGEGGPEDLADTDPMGYDDETAFVDVGEPETPDIDIW